MMSIVDLGKRLVISAKLGDTDEVRLLMTNGAPFTTDWFGASPLHMSAQYGHLDTAEVLLRAGISRDARTKVDRTPLHLAAQEGHKDIVELLIGHGADVNAVDMLRMTPLHWAVERSHVPVIKFLLSCKADVHAINKFYKTPMDIADDNGADDIIQILKDYSNSSKRAKPKATYQQKIRLPAITKHPMVIQKQAASPFNVIKTDSVSAEQLKNVVNRTVRVFDPNMNSTATIASCANTSAKISYSSRPVFIRANLGQPTSLKSSPSKSINEIDSTESTTQSCTNVLATLAALAEATAPNTTISTQEALQWLEMHGISMLPSDNSTVVASALEGGQTVSLTEAGKLALTWVKDQQSNNVSRDISSSLQNISIMNNRAMSNTTIPNQKIITIVAGQTQLPSIISTQQQPFVLVGSHGSQIGDQPPLKKIKTYLSKKELKPVTNGKVCASAIGENDKSSLQKELEKIKKEAAEYKAQLLLKEHEAELYRKQLEQLKRSQ